MDLSSIVTIFTRFTMSYLLFHPSVAPFVQQAARALYEAGQLEQFVTTVRDDPSSARQRLFCALGRMMGTDLRSQFRRRAVTEIPAHCVKSHPWGELLRLATGRLDRDGRLTDMIWERTEIGFDRRVARKLHRGLTGVYGYEHSSLATFLQARSLGLRVIYDVPAPESEFVHELLGRELDRFPEMRTAYHRHTAIREERRLARRRAEWKCADVIIAASQFTRDSYVQAGLDVTRVRIIPYGAPPPVTSAVAPTPNNTAPLTFLWAGTFSIRKGAHYLLEAWRAGRFGQHARLLVFGTVMLPDRITKPLPEGVEFRGSVPRAELMEFYHRRDALVFPTLCDGFGMVVTESWSQGLPVITTHNAGAADLIKPGKNGLLIEPASVDALVGALDWCTSHREELCAMRTEALATATAWQWQDYRQALRDVIFKKPES